jgi:uncharacterized protein with HEPN domain
MSYEPRELLRHILAEAEYLSGLRPGLTRAALDDDPTIQRAVVRSLEVIGEATKKVPAKTRSEHPAVEWRAMAGMRDRLIHDYFGVDLDIVWEVIEHKISALRDHLVAILGPDA